MADQEVVLAKLQQRRLDVAREIQEVCEKDVTAVMDGGSPLFGQRTLSLTHELNVLDAAIARLLAR